MPAEALFPGQHILAVPRGCWATVSLPSALTQGALGSLLEQIGTVWSHCASYIRVHERGNYHTELRGLGCGGDTPIATALGASMWHMSQSERRCSQ